MAVAVALMPGAAKLRAAMAGAKGTALRPVVAWMYVAWGTAVLAQLVALLEAPQSGRTWTGHLTYLDSLFALAAGVSVLNARRPGAGAWAFLTTLLVGVLLIPWLEGSGLVRDPAPLARLRLDAPWSVFYALLAATAVANHLPTAYGGVAFWLGCGWVAVFAGLRRWVAVEDLGMLWSLWGVCVSAALGISELDIRRESKLRRSSLDRLWLWFRDRWGLVWALRVQDRFNATAAASRWPIRMGWAGVRHEDGSPAKAEEVPEEAVRTMIALLGRFATRRRLETESGRHCETGSAEKEVPTGDG